MIISVRTANQNTSLSEAKIVTDNNISINQQLYFLALRKQVYLILLTSAGLQRHFLLLYSRSGSSDSIRLRVTVVLSISPDVKLTPCMSKIYVPGGVGAEGLPYHAGDGSFVLGAITRRRGERGQDGGSQESKICCAAQRTSVWWSWAE